MPLFFVFAFFSWKQEFYKDHITNHNRVMYLSQKIGNDEIPKTNISTFAVARVYNELKILNHKLNFDEIDFEIFLSSCKEKEIHIINDNWDNYWAVKWEHWFNVSLRSINVSFETKTILEQWDEPVEYVSNLLISSWKKGSSKFTSDSTKDFLSTKVFKNLKSRQKSHVETMIAVDLEVPLHPAEIPFKEVENWEKVAFILRKEWNRNIKLIKPNILAEDAVLAHHASKVLNKYVFKDVKTLFLDLEGLNGSSVVAYVHRVPDYFFGNCTLEDLSTFSSSPLSKVRVMKQAFAKYFEKKLKYRCNDKFVPLNTVGDYDDCFFVIS